MSASRSRRGARVTVQLPADARDRLRDLAGRRGQTVSALLRTLALEALANIDGAERPDDPPVPSTPEAMREQVLVSAFKAARDGDVSAMRMVLLELRQPGAPPPAAAPSDDEDEDDSSSAKVTRLDALRRRAAG